MNKKLKLAVFASGRGSNLRAIASACQSGELEAEVALVVCDRAAAGALEVAKEFGLNGQTILPKEFESKAHYERHIVELCKEQGVELICLAGYMRLVGETLLEAYAQRIINLHPSLLPAFKGARAIEEAMEYGVKVFGATIHYVDESLDGGKIIAQRALPYEGDSIEELTDMLHQVEHLLYIDTIKKLIKTE